jgi:hypothetical protein
VLHQHVLRLLLGVQLLEFLNERLSHRNQSLFGPGEEPINRAFVKEGRELAETISELLPNWREAEADVEVVPDTVHEVGVELAGSRVGTLELLDVVIAGVSKESLLFVLGQQSRDLTRGEDHADELKELFFLDF